MSKKTIDQLLTEISEDKYQNLSTTSYTFKRDMWNFFTDCKDKICVEFGTHKSLLKNQQNGCCKILNL